MFAGGLDCVRPECYVIHWVEELGEEFGVKFPSLRERPAVELRNYILPLLISFRIFCIYVS